MDLPGNLSKNLSLGPEDPRPRPFRLSVLGAIVLTLLGCLVAATFAWNALVLATIAQVRTFHRAPYNLVVSMAVSDALVATLVMPISLAYELAGRRWRLGAWLCRLWVTCDVLCCTASIWSVTAIALDRYWSVTRHLAYTGGARRRASNLMIALTWALSAAIALAPLLFGWAETYSERRGVCQVSRAPADAVVSTLSAFYLPLGVVLFVYCKIYRAARLRLGFRRSNSVHPASEAVQVRVRPLNLQLCPGFIPSTPPSAFRKWDFLVCCCFSLGGGRTG